MAGDILRFVDREMTSPEGPFYSALDAETETVEREVLHLDRGGNP